MPSVRFLPDEATVVANLGRNPARHRRAGRDTARGGKARCSTCRVLASGRHLSERTPQEAELVDPLQFGDSIRLACQTTTSGSVTVRRLVVDDDDRALADQRGESPVRSAVGGGA